MARLISPPAGLRANGLDILSGPRAVGGASGTSIENFTQTVSSPFGLWRLQYSFPPMKGQMLRRYRGWISALGGGANATRWTFCDWDGLSREAAGVASAIAVEIWSNGQPWANGQRWHGAYPTVPVTQAAELGDTTICLADEFWGHALDIGDIIGFQPFYLGMHIVTEVFDAGLYRVWPSLRKALTTDDLATLRPVLALRLESEDAAPISRGATSASNLQVTFVEVLDYDARDYFAD